jgi:hypothetical protein
MKLLPIPILSYYTFIIPPHRKIKKSEGVPGGSGKANGLLYAGERKGEGGRRKAVSLEKR